MRHRPLGENDAQCEPHGQSANVRPVVDARRHEAVSQMDRHKYRNARGVAPAPPALRSPTRQEAGRQCAEQADIAPLAPALIAIGLATKLAVEPARPAAT